MEVLQQLEVIVPMVCGLVESTPADQLGNATPCEEFTVEGILDHVSGYLEVFTPRLRGEEPSGGDAAPTGTSQARFDHALRDLLATVSRPGVLDAPADSSGGMPPAQVAALIAADSLIHGWDIAVATDRPWDPPADVVASVDGFLRAALTDEWRTGGNFGPEQVAPADATAMERIAAFSGRTVPFVAPA